MTARRAISASILLLFSFLASAAPASEERELPTATVLCYHIVEAPAAPRMHIDRQTFRQHLRYLEMTGYNIVPLRHVYEYVSGKRSSLPKNAVVITFDDGWRSTYTEVFPEMQKRNFPFTVFIYPNIIGKTANALTWAQIREMADAGVDVQSHALTHPFLTRRRHRSMSDEKYAAWLRNELSESKKILEEKSGRKVQFLAYPYGDYDEQVAEAASKAGYTAALTCDFGRVKKGSDPLRMKRFVIDDTMSFASFRKYLGATPMQLAEMTPRPGKAADPAVTTVSAKIPHFKNVDPRSVGMALLSLGSTVPYSYDARNGEVTLMLREAITNIKSYHRAVVWAVDRRTGKRVEATWVFRIPGPDDQPQPPKATPAEPVDVLASASSAPPAVHAGGSPK